MDKILIVDDSDFDRKMIKRALESKSTNVSFTELSSGQSAADVIAAERPKIAILDIRMPGMDGFEVLATIRSNSKFDDVPVVMVSGSDEPQDRVMAEANGANGYFVKPPSAVAYLSLGQDIYDQYLCCQS